MPKLENKTFNKSIKRNKRKKTKTNKTKKKSSNKKTIKNKFMKLKCSPQLNPNPVSCLSTDGLKYLRDQWNIRHPDKIISTKATPKQML